MTERKCRVEGSNRNAFPIVANFLVKRKYSYTVTDYYKQGNKGQKDHLKSDILNKNMTICGTYHMTILGLYRKIKTSPKICKMLLTNYPALKITKLLFHPSIKISS